MSQDDRLQLRIDSNVKDGAFAVFREMGISPSEAVRMFFTQVQKTKTIPFIVQAEETAEAVEPGYAEWLRARLDHVTQGVETGKIATYEQREAMIELDKKIANLRTRDKKLSPSNA